MHLALMLLLFVLFLPNCCEGGQQATFLRQRDAEQGSKKTTLIEDGDYWERFLQQDIGSIPVPTSAPTSATCRVVLWSDEFNSDTTDSSHWSFDIGNGIGGWGNLELQNYTDDPSNVRLQDGSLVITAIAETLDGERAFTSGRIRSEDKVEVRYGNIEARIKIPDLANGIWPAFWTLGGNLREVGWPFAGEIDIMEMGSAEAIQDGVVNRRFTSAAHWEDSGSGAVFSGTYTSPVNLADGDFHVYRLEWTPDRLATYVDENFVWEMDISPQACTDCTELHQPHFLLFTMAVGGTFPGILDESNITASFPAEMVIDYVRVCDNGNTVMSGTVVEDPVDFTFDCGNPEQCTNSALNNYAGEFTCGSRIAFLMESEGLSQEDACRKIAGDEFPSQCGVCISQVIDCNLPETCTDDVLEGDADGFSCRDRISFLVSIQGNTELEACDRVAGAEFSQQCGPCTTKTINCGLPETCTDATLGAEAGEFTCGDRIAFLISTGLSEIEACNQVAGIEFPIRCRPCNPIDCNQPDSCTSDILDSDAAGFNCRDRITFLIDSSGLSEADACRQIASIEFPDQCGPCFLQELDCGLPDTCTSAILDADAEGFSCRDRITFLIESSGLSEAEACRQIASVEFPNQCGPCFLPELDCGLPDTCTSEILDSDAEGFTCRDRITFLIESSGLSEADACRQIASVEFPNQCGLCFSQELDCGLPDTCTSDILDADAGGFTCRDRITFLIDSSGLSEAEACSQIASVEFPNQCGPCFSQELDCGLPDTCTSEILDADAEGFSCRDRITFLIESSGLSEADACRQIAGIEFSTQCNGCNPPPDEP